MSNLALFVLLLVSASTYADCPTFFTADNLSSKLRGSLRSSLKLFHMIVVGGKKVALQIEPLDETGRLNFDLPLNWRNHKVSKTDVLLTDPSSFGVRAKNQLKKIMLAWLCSRTIC